MLFQHEFKDGSELCPVVVLHKGVSSFKSFIHITGTFVINTFIYSFIYLCIYLFIYLFIEKTDKPKNPSSLYLQIRLQNGAGKLFKSK